MGAAGPHNPEYVQLSLFRNLPTPGDPFLEVRALGADGGVSAVARVDVRVVGQREQALTDRSDDPLEADGVMVGIARPAGKERVTCKQVLADQKARRAGRVPRRVDGLQ